MSEFETTERPSASSGVTHPEADQLHGRLLEDFKRSLADGAKGVYERWGYLWLHSMSDEEVVEQREKLGFKPVDALDFYNQGCRQAALEDFAGAAASFAKALALDAELSEAEFNHALALELAGKKAESRAAWKAWLEKHGEASEEEAKQVKDHLAALADA
jgi:tetratricopeptide (TPR) repeat protein